MYDAVLRHDISFENISLIDFDFTVLGTQNSFLFIKHFELSRTI